MKFSHIAAVATVLSTLSACQTMGGATPTANEVLLAGVEMPVVKENASIPQLSTSNPICLKFYQNTATYVDLPLAGSSRPGLGGMVLKTLVLGTLSGVTGGAVTAAGIESAFVESALIGTASQVTYNVGETVYDEVVQGDAPVAATAAVEPMTEITKAAAQLGCPAPDVNAIEALKTAQAAASN